MVVVASVITCPVFNWAEDPMPQLALTSQDRILVIAPHPDDETIGAGGVIQEAVRLNIPVHVMYLTNGDSNPLAFSLYKKRPVFGKRQALEMGQLRQKEAIEAASRLGLHEDQLIFLGYPDYGTLSIFRKFWQTKKPYRSTLIRAVSVPYSLSLTPGATHEAQSVLSDFKKVLLEAKPTKVFVTHPADDNADHQAAYLFLRVALWDLQEQLGDVSVYTFLVHAVGWPRPMGFCPQWQLSINGHLHSKFNQWVNFELSPQQLDRKKEAVERYHTQMPYKPKFLYSFVRANELFALVSDITLRPQTMDAKAWRGLDHDQEFRKTNNRLDMQSRVALRSVVYGLDAQHLVVKIKLNQWSRSGFDINLYLFGYRKGVPFKEMPKYRVQLTNDHGAVVFDGQRRVRTKGVKVSRTGNDFFVSFPLSLMNDPDKVISSTAVRIQNWPMESSMWAVMELNDD